MQRSRLNTLKVGSRLCAAWSLSLSFGISRASAQESADTAPGVQSAAPTTLADNLREVAQSGETALAVGADKAHLLKNATKPLPGSRVTQIAPAYGHATRRYGSVTAIAPTTMTLLNANLGLPNIYVNIPPREAFTLLAADMSDAQRQMLTSERGIGLPDMISDLQRDLFRALIPSSSLPYRQRPEPGELYKSGPEHTLENPLQNGRLRVGMKQMLVVHSLGREIMGMVGGMRDPNGPPIYDVSNQNHLFKQDAVDGATVHSLAANTLKKSQLNYGLPTLQTPVSLDGLKTVGQLIVRIGAKTRLELYADRHYEARLLTVTGANRSAPAGDLLRALAVCVTGTYRRVGPAYVLTDDLVGVGTRRTQIAEFLSDADVQRQKPLAEAEAKLQQSQALWKRPLSNFGDPMAPSPEQMARKEENELGGGAFRILKLNFDDLTPVQQNALKGYAEGMARVSPDHPERGIDFERPISMHIIPSVQLLVPGVDGPIDTDLGQWVSDNFHDMTGWRSRDSRKPAPQPNGTNAPEESLPPMAGLVSAIPHRVLLADCRITADVDNTIAKMKRMGLNELWLVVFTNGTARIGGTPFPSLAPDAPDLLTHALKITQGTDIALYPVIDVFQWGATMPPAQVDLTITGETSAQYAQRVHKRNALNAAANGNEPPGEPSPRLTASVFAPEVAARLNGLVSSLSQRPGVSGVVWRETDPAGYAEISSTNSIHHAEGGQLGYTENARLAFLRSYHADPIDVEGQARSRGLEQRANTSLPLFDDWELDATLEREWNRFRAAANLQTLGALYAAAKPQNGGLQAQNGSVQAQAIRKDASEQKYPASQPIVFVRERHAAWGTTWYGLWNGLETSLPTHHYDFEETAENGDFKRAPEEFEQARQQGKINLVRLPFWGGLDENTLVKQWQHAFKDLAQNKKWDGFVLEMMLP